MDSDATFHVNPNIEWYSNYLVGTSDTVRLNNGQECKITGTGEVAIQLSNDNIITLHQVRHVPALKRSMFSINMLAEDGYKTTLNESTWMISRGNLRIGSGHKYNNLYPLMAINPEGAVNVAEKTDPNLWHGRLGHMSQPRLDHRMHIGAVQLVRCDRVHASILLVLLLPNCTSNHKSLHMSMSLIFDLQTK